MRKTAPRKGRKGKNGIAFPRTISVLVDTAERKQRAIRFPPQLVWYDAFGNRIRMNVRTIPVTLRTGDYTIGDAEGTPYTYQGKVITLLERKGSWEELLSNMLSRDKVRQRYMLDRLSRECWLPMLFLDMAMPPAALNKSVSVPTARMPSSCMQEVYGALCRECASRGIPIAWYPPGKGDSTRTGMLLLTQMWQAVYSTLWLRNDIGPVPTPEGEQECPDLVGGRRPVVPGKRVQGGSRKVKKRRRQVPVGRGKSLCTRSARASSKAIRTRAAKIARVSTP
jgi:hypothetical protein